MPAIKKDTAPSATRAEAWTILPEEVAIYAPAPVKEVALIDWPNPTEENPKGVLKIKVALTGDNDRHDEALPDFDHSFTWDVTSEKARSQIATYVTRGCAMVNINGRLHDQVNVVSNGRHTTLLARVANQIRSALGEKPCKIVMRRMVIPDGFASTFSLLANVTYDRDPAALGRQYAKAMAERNITPEELGVEIGKSASTVRRFVALGQGKVAHTKAKEKHHARLKVPQQRTFFEALKTLHVSDEALMVAETILFGKPPDDATTAVKAAFRSASKAGQKDSAK